MPIRIQRRRTKGWKMPGNTVSVTRPGMWGNPFIVGEFGTKQDCIDAHTHLLSGKICVVSNPSIEQQKKHYEFVRDNINKLKGKNIACFCKEGTTCHGDIYIKLANQ